MGAHPLLDNILWEAFSHGQPQFTVGSGGVRRYAPGFSAIVAFEDPSAPDFDSLAQFSEIGDSFYCDQWSGEAPDGWSIEAETTMFKMVYEGGSPLNLENEGIAVLQPAHAQQALDLAILTNPGPFGLRTPELGNYYGFFEGDRLVAMAGERMYAKPFREISGVCTHPDFQGRGYAKRLMIRLMREAIERNEIPFLHVLSRNELARGLYRRLGFTEYLETTVRVIRRTS